MKFNEWWDTNRAKYHWSLRQHYQEVWEAGVMEGSKQAQVARSGTSQGGGSQTPDTVVQPDARFEEWADDQGYPLTPTLQGDGYQDLRTEGAWGAWCAALGAAPAPVAQGDDMQQCRKTLGLDKHPSGVLQ